MTGPAPASRPPLLQQYVAAGRLREQPAGRLEVVTLWEKAIARLRDSTLPGISIEGGLEGAYQAAHSACLAVLATRGLRTAAGHGHHEMAFAGVAALGVPGLEELVPDSEEIRGLRRGSMYVPRLGTCRRVAARDFRSSGPDRATGRVGAGRRESLRSRTRTG